jgi:hypothetical protein
MTFRKVALAILMLKTFEALSARFDIVGLTFSQNTGTYMLFALIWAVVWACIWNVTGILEERMKS